MGPKEMLCSIRANLNSDPHASDHRARSELDEGLRKLVDLVEWLVVITEPVLIHTLAGTVVVSDQGVVETSRVAACGVQSLGRACTLFHTEDAEWNCPDCEQALKYVESLGIRILSSLPATVHQLSIATSYPARLVLAGLLHLQARGKVLPDPVSGIWRAAQEAEM